MDNNKSSEDIKLNQNKKYFIIIGAVLISTVVLLVTFIVPKEDGSEKDKLSRNAKTYDVTSNAKDKSTWMYKSERLLNEGLKSIEKSSQQKSDALMERLTELEAKTEKLQTELEISKKQETIAKTLLEKVNGNSSKQAETTIQQSVSQVQENIIEDINLVNPVDTHQQWGRPMRVISKSHLPSQRILARSGKDTSTQNMIPNQEDDTYASAGSIFSINLNLSPKKEKKTKFPTTDEVIPAGSFARGILLNGIDVSTGDFAKKHPSSMVVRLVHQGSLPNEVVGDMKDCRVTASAFGHRSNERAEIRVERLVCVQNDKSVITTDVTGYVVGADGKQGVRGKIVRRGAEQLWQGMIGQGLSSMAKAVSVAAGTSSVSAQGVVKTFDGKEAVRSAGYSGVGGALDRFAEQAIKELNEIKPVIQVSAGLPVDVVFLDTSSFGEKKEEVPQAADIITEQVSKIIKED